MHVWYKIFSAFLPQQTAKDNLERNDASQHQSLVVGLRVCTSSAANFASGFHIAFLRRALLSSSGQVFSIAAGHQTVRSSWQRCVGSPHHSGTAPCWQGQHKLAAAQDF